MKKILHLTLVLFFSVQLLSAIEYVPFPTRNAQWNVLITTSPSEFQYVAGQNLLRYSLQGDTVINNILYNKLCVNNGTDDNPVYVGIGGLREENKVIYYTGLGYGRAYYRAKPQKAKEIKNCAPSINLYSDFEVVLYDFNKQVGDTIPWIYSYNIISKIDSVKINGSYRKRYNFEWGNEVIIEGIGSVVNGLLGTLQMEFVTCGGSFSVEHVCFSQNGKTLYLNPKFTDCNSTQIRQHLTYGTFWSERVYSMFGCPSQPVIQYFIENDTVVNRITYKKLIQRNNFDSNSRFSLIGLVREDAGKVYGMLEFLKYQQGTPDIKEMKMYDFTLQEGDSVQLYLYGSQEKTSLYVTKTDSIQLLNGEKRKRLTLNNHLVWIEGIGDANSGFYQFYLPQTTCGISYSLACYVQNEQELFHNEHSYYDGVCGKLSGVENIRQADPRFIVTPSPVKEILYVKSDVNFENNMFELLDLQGKSVSITQISSNANSFSVSALPKGLYIYKISNDGKLLQVGKISKE